jgi:tRNA threonylcarbamoyladenosine biosynthesis protein TsaE
VAAVSSRRPALDLISHSPDQTRRFGYHLGRLARPGDVILLHGQIGVGKTALAQGIARGLGVEGYVQSPTFTLASEHTGHTADGKRATLYHLDLYRLEEAGELASFGYEEYFDEPAGIVVIEWPERLAEEVPEEHLLISLEHLADTKRRLAFLPQGPRAQEMTEAFRAEVFRARRRSTPAGD